MDKPINQLNTRRYDIDALRVIAFGLLIFYHVGMFFVPWDFHIKNNVVYEGLTYPMLFLNQWRLPLLFVISGMGTFFALSKRNGKSFAIERIKRLFIPFIFGIFFIVPPQIYVERLDKGQFHGSYFEYWPVEAFSGGIYPEGNISWHHLWFILYLLIFSLLLLPVFLYLRKHTNAWILRKMRTLGKHAMGLYVVVLPLLLWRIFLAPHFPQTNALINDWYGLMNYCTFFFIGFLLIAVRDVFWKTVIRCRRKYLLAGIIAFISLMCLWYLTPAFTGRFYLSSLIRTVNMWSWILVLFGYAAVYLNKPGKMLAYCNEAVYPFYILHQSVMMVLCYYMKDVSMGFFGKFMLLSLGTFGITWLIYKCCIRRFSFVRPLFGMKARKC